MIFRLSSNFVWLDSRESLLKLGELGAFGELLYEKEDLSDFSIRSFRCFLISFNASLVLPRCCVACLWYLFLFGNFAKITGTLVTSMNCRLSPPSIRSPRLDPSSVCKIILKPAATSAFAHFALEML